MQRKIIRKHSLEIILESLEPHPSPKASLEQYTIPPDVAAKILYIATYTYDDIIGKKVFDLGCGTGRLAIGAAFLGAKEVVGIDVDLVAVKIAKKNAKKIGLGYPISWIVSDIASLIGNGDTVIQNPPFGVQKRSADRAFLRKALEVANVIYSLHKSGKSNRTFLRNYIEKNGGEIGGVFQMKLTIPHLFDFHEKRKHVIDIDLYRIRRVA